HILTCFTVQESYKYYCEAYENRDSWLKDRQPGTITSIDKTAAEFGWQEEVHQKALAILEKAVAITEEYAGTDSEMAAYWRQGLQTRKDINK
ncbi:MAG: hypothetical protein II704_04015, partial [Erysipelotrichaceae bacterium]|nr:hypothetical protein [Erysipelotrichaceae bacterium]